MEWVCKLKLVQVVLYCFPCQQRQNSQNNNIFSLNIHYDNNIYKTIPLPLKNKIINLRKNEEIDLKINLGSKILIQLIEICEYCVPKVVNFMINGYQLCFDQIGTWKRFRFPGVYQGNIIGQLSLKMTMIQVKAINQNKMKVFQSNKKSNFLPIITKKLIQVSIQKDFITSQIKIKNFYEENQKYHEQNQMKQSNLYQKLQYLNEKMNERIQVQQLIEHLDHNIQRNLPNIQQHLQQQQKSSNSIIFYSIIHQEDRQKELSDN